MVAALSVTQELGNRVDDGQHGADFDHEHHRVFPLYVGAEHHQRLPESRFEQFGVEQAGLPAVATSELEFFRAGAREPRFLDQRGRHIAVLSFLGILVGLASLDPSYHSSCRSVS